MHSLRLTSLHRRPRLGIALLAFALVASNALAAMGLCIVKSPLPAAAAVAGDPACAQHGVDAVDGGAPSESAPPAHCPQDDPGAQVRIGDLPTAGLLAVPYVLRLSLALPHALAAADPPDDLAATPLYARLSRLLL